MLCARQILARTILHLINTSNSAKFSSCVHHSHPYIHQNISPKLTAVPLSATHLLSVIHRDKKETQGCHDTPHPFDQTDTHKHAFLATPQLRQAPKQEHQLTWPTHRHTHKSTHSHNHTSLPPPSCAKPHSSSTSSLGPAMLLAKCTQLRRTGRWAVPLGGFAVAAQKQQQE